MVWKPEPACFMSSSSRRVLPHHEFAASSCPFFSLISGPEPPTTFDIMSGLNSYYKNVFSEMTHHTYSHTHMCIHTMYRFLSHAHMCTCTFTNKYICEHTYMYDFQSSKEWEIDFTKSRRQIPYPNNTCILSLTGTPLALDLEKSAVTLGCRDSWLIKISRGFHSFICFFQAEPLGGSRNSELTL